MKRTYILTLIISTLVFHHDLKGQVEGGKTYNEEEVVLKTATGDIHGTLTVPAGKKKSPVVLIIAGSGPTDRNCNSTLGIKTNAYKMLAERFALEGISTLRYDKRGIAASMSAGSKESLLRFEHYIEDAQGWIDLLKKDKRFRSVIVLGHSEGSLIGMIASERSGASKFISLAGIGSPADSVLKKQLKGQLTPQLMQESNNILDSLRNGRTVKKFNPYLVSLYRPSVQPYLISWIKYNPAAEIAKLKIPVLIVQGTTDIQVTVEEARLLAAGKPDAKLLIVDKMNHILKESESDRNKNIATYTKPELPLKQEMADEIVSFIKSR